MRPIKARLAAALLPLVLAVACASQPAPTPTAPPPSPTVAAAPATAAPAPTPTAVAAAPTTAPSASPTAAATPAAQGEPTVKLAADPKLGPILTDARGMTLYRYTRDQADVSNCYDQCAQNWPPLIVTSGQPALPPGLPGTLATTTRKDGSKQVTFNGMPLYYWVKDTKPGDTTGQNVGSVWFVVKPGEILTAEGQPTVKVAQDAKLGQMLVDAHGWSLYRYTKDQADVTNCYDQCAQNWPPLMVTAGEPVLPAGVPGKLGTITRKDGSKQVTYNGEPLYYWAKDAKPGDTTGQNVGSVWFVVAPSAPTASASGGSGGQTY